MCTAEVFQKQVFSKNLEMRETDRNQTSFKGFTLISNPTNQLILIIYIYIEYLLINI